MLVDSEKRPLSSEELQLLDDKNSRENMRGILLKKGTWTSAEDSILINYVNKHGEGNWNAVQKHSGLFRCGKSCRLRWVNHLRPNLKKGPFTAEEEQLIIELHAKMGNKWARMASYLSGHTDNEIKNYWNTRIKRRRRAGLPLYNQEACLRPLLDNTGDDPMMMNSRCSGYSNTSSHAAPDVILHNKSASHDSFPYFPELASESHDGMPFEAVGLSRQNIFASMQPPKCYCDSEVMVKNELFSLEAAQVDPLIKSTGFIFPYDLNPDDHNWSLGVIQESHSSVNGNFSTPTPAYEAVKSELPSFQYPATDSSNWKTSNAASPLPDPNETVRSEYSSPHNSGLLDALLYKARTISGVKNQSSKKNSTSSDVVILPTDFADKIIPEFCKTEIRNNSEPVSPLDSATSMFSGSELTAARGMLTYRQPVLKTYSECEVKCEPIDSVFNQFEETTLAMLDSSDPDITNWLEQQSCITANQTTVDEAVAEALESSNEFATDFRYMGPTVPSQDQGWGLGS